MTKMALICSKKDDDSVWELYEIEKSSLNKVLYSASIKLEIRSVDKYLPNRSKSQVGVFFPDMVCRYIGSFNSDVELNRSQIEEERGRRVISFELLFDG